MRSKLICYVVLSILLPRQTINVASCQRRRRDKRRVWNGSYLNRKGPRNRDDERNLHACEFSVDELSQRQASIYCLVHVIRC